MAEMLPRRGNYAAPSIAHRGPDVPRNLRYNLGVAAAIKPEINLDPPAGRPAQQR